MFFRIKCRIINISRSILVIKESKANKQQNDFNYWNSFPTANRYNNYQSKFKLKICTYIFKRPLNLKLKSMSCKSLLTLRWVRRYLDVAAQIHTEHLWFFVTAMQTAHVYDQFWRNIGIRYILYSSSTYIFIFHTIVCRTGSIAYQMDLWRVERVRQRIGNGRSGGTGVISVASKDKSNPDPSHPVLEPLYLQTRHKSHPSLLVYTHKLWSPILICYYITGKPLCYYISPNHNVMTQSNNKRVKRELWLFIEKGLNKIHTCRGSSFLLSHLPPQWEHTYCSGGGEGVLIITCHYHTFTTYHLDF